MNILVRSADYLFRMACQNREWSRKNIIIW